MACHLDAMHPRLRLRRAGKIMSILPQDLGHVNRDGHLCSSVPGHITSALSRLDLEKNTGQPEKPKCQMATNDLPGCVPDCMRHTCHKQFFVVNRRVECGLFSFPVLKLEPGALWMPGKHSVTELTSAPI